MLSMIFKVYISLLLLVLSESGEESVAFFFKTEPSDAWVKVGGSASFFCATDTDVEITWTWAVHAGTSDGASSIVLDGTSDTLVYGPVTADDDGKFISCAADIYGTQLLSRYAMIRITHQDTVFLEQPDDVETKAGTDHVRINCKVPAGEPAPYVTWQKNGVEVDNANSFVDPLGGLNIVNVAETDAGTYTCTSNSLNNDFDSIVSREAVLTVSGTVASKSLSVTYDVSFAEARYKIPARRGDTVRVLCGFLGTPTPTFAIKSEDTELVSNAKQQVGPHGTWATVQGVDVEEFKCVGSNTLGSQTLNVVVELKGALTVTGGTTEVSIIEAESTTLECSDTGAASDPAYSWYKNGQLLSGETKNSLKLSAAKRAQSGMYQCFAAVPDARDHATFAVSVASTEAEPVKVTVGGEEYAVLGSAHRISCVGQGNPIPSVTWYKNTANEESAVALESIIYQESFTELLAILTVAEMKSEDNGVTYKCKGTNTDLYDTSIKYKAEASMKLTVVDGVPPSLSLPSTSDILSGSKITLICMVDGSPPPTITWFKNGGLIEGATDDKFITNGDAGEYTCTATNVLGSVSGSVLVKAKAAYTGGQVILVLLIAGVILLFSSVGILILARKNELQRRMAAAKAKDDLLIEKEKLAANPYRMGPTPTPITPNPDADMENGVAVVPVAEAECQTPRPILVSSPQNVVSPTPH